MKDGMGGGKLFIIALAAVFACSLASKLRIRQDRPSSGSDRDSAIPPREEQICERLRLKNDMVRCDDSGSFSSEQTKDGSRFYCVNKETGVRLNLRYFMRGNGSCDSVEACPDLSCPATVRCRYGYMLDENDCQICNCKAPPIVKKCPTFREYLKSGECNCSCVMDPSRAADRTAETRDNCLTCDSSCSANPDDQTCAVMNQAECNRTDVFGLVGKHGRPQCSSGLTRGMRCKPAQDRIPTDRSMGLAKRKLSADLGDSLPPCEKGLTCKEDTPRKYKCDIERSSGVCVVARQQDSYLRCDSDGSYLPLQCRPMPINGMPIPTDAPATHVKLEFNSRIMPHVCHCVQPSDGMMIQGSRKIVTNMRDVSSMFCDSKVEVPGCMVRAQGKREMFVRHGTTFIDTENCRFCECRKGNPTFLCSSPANCTVLKARPVDYMPPSCVLPDGDVIPNNGRKTVGCSICFCKEGRMRCIKRPGCDDEDGTPPYQKECDECDKETGQMVVCGRGSVTYTSQCYATKCARNPLGSVQQGSCRSQNACAEYSCGTNETCFNMKSQTACLGARECSADQQRLCVNLDIIICPEQSSDDDSNEDEKVCSTDTMTYKSFCEFVHKTTNAQIKHRGACENCPPQKVCSSKGQTFDSICELNYEADSRLDYMEECLDSTALTQEQKCSRVREEGRCRINRDTCNTVSRLDGCGCCPVCGNLILLVLDVDALSDVALIYPDLTDMDSFVSSLLDNNDLRDVPTKCYVESQICKGNLAIAFKGRTESDGLFCSEKIRMMERIIDGQLDTGSDGQRRRRQDSESLHQVYDFVMGTQVGEEEKPTVGGAVRLEAVVGMVTLLLLIASGLMMF